VTAVPNRFLPEGHYVVCAKANDPLSNPARARLIWAANTAQAMQSLGVPALLAGGAQDHGFPVESFAGKAAAKRRIAQLYGIDTDFDLRIVANNRRDPDRIYNAEYPQNVLPHAGLVHTRDPRIAALCSKRAIPFILEFHDEDYQEPEHWEGIDFASPSCKALIAITASVSQRLIALGLPADKILVQNSGANSRASADRFEAASRWRASLLEDWYERLVVYTGGLQTERGVEHILWAAKALPRFLFVLGGGHANDIRRLEAIIEKRGITNIKLPGYMPFDTVCEIQQAADVLLFTRAATARATVTSPLKFFEYLLSGRPVVSARIPSVESVDGGKLAVHYYNPGSTSSLVEAIVRATSGKRWTNAREDANIQAGADFVWEARQRRIMDFIGPIEVKTTF